MATGSLHVNRDIILATKRKHLAQRKQHTPTEAVLAMAQMQRRPRRLLSFASDKQAITLIAQVTRPPRYDPVTSALHCLYNGAHAIAFFTDHAIYEDDLDDMLIVARALGDAPVLYQNYILDEYNVMLARSADASSVMLYNSFLDRATLRQCVSMAQRWKMTAMVQIDTPEDLDAALTLSPHALAFGDPQHTGNLEQTIEFLQDVRHDLPHYVHVLPVPTLYTLDEVAFAVQTAVDAIIVSEDLLRHERSARIIRDLLQTAEAERAER